MSSADGDPRERGVEPMLVVRNVCKSFPSTNGAGHELKALKAISFEVARNEFVSILGPSGCGKTTMIRIVAGLLDADAGEVLVDGRPIAGPGQDRAMVFQNFGLLPWRTVLRNVALGLEAQGLSRRERAETAARYVELVGLKGFENYFPHQISGGMQQRVGIARALACDPKILLMDEPYGAVDAQTREKMQEELLRIWSTTEKTVLFVTHSIDEAIYLSDRVIIMRPNPGEIERTITVNLPRPRDLSDVQSERRFAEMRFSIRGILRSMGKETTSTVQRDI